MLHQVTTSLFRALALPASTPVVDLFPGEGQLAPCLVPFFPTMYAHDISGVCNSPRELQGEPVWEFAASRGALIVFKVPENPALALLGAAAVNYAFVERNLRVFVVLPKSQRTTFAAALSRPPFLAIRAPSPTDAALATLGGFCSLFWSPDRISHHQLFLSDEHYRLAAQVPHAFVDVLAGALFQELSQPTRPALPVVPFATPLYFTPFASLPRPVPRRFAPSPYDAAQPQPTECLDLRSLAALPQVNVDARVPLAPTLLPSSPTIDLEAPPTSNSHPTTNQKQNTSDEEEHANDASSYTSDN